VASTREYSVVTDERVDLGERLNGEEKLEDGEWLVAAVEVLAPRTRITSLAPPYLGYVSATSFEPS
jgi:hypothetical protein